MIENCLSEVYLSQIIQIFAATMQSVILLNAYKDFNNIFLTKNFNQLLLYKNHNYAINLVNDKQIF